MRVLTDDYRLSGDSNPDITGRLKAAAMQLGRYRKFQGLERRRRIESGPLLNAIVLHYLEMDEAERVAFGLRAIARLEHYLSETDAEHARTDAATVAAAEAFAAASRTQDDRRPTLGGGIDPESGGRPKKSPRRTNRA